MKVISVSDVKTHATCEQMYDFKCRQRRGLDSSDALLLGTTTHRFLEHRLLTGEYKFSIMEDCRPALSTKGQRELNSLIPVLGAWAPHPEWKVVAGTEIQLVDRTYPLLGDIPEVFLGGTLDCLVEFNGGLWHLQHKTIGGSFPTDVFAEIQRTDWHECFYQHLVELPSGLAEQFQLPYKGTILNLVKKVSAKFIAEKGPGMAIEFHYITRSREIVDKGVHDIRMRANFMLQALHVEKNRSACGGKFGNSLCQYKPVCDGYITIDNPLYHDLEDRYAE